MSRADRACWRTKVTGRLLAEGPSDPETLVAAAQSPGVPLRMLPCVVTRADPHSYLLLEWEAFDQLSTDCGRRSCEPVARPAVSPALKPGAAIRYGRNPSMRL